MFNYNQETIYSLLCAVLPCFIYLLVWGRKKPLLHSVWVMIFVLYCWQVYDITGAGGLSDILYRPEGSINPSFIQGTVNLIPFQNFTTGFFLNILMCVPLGLLLPFVWKAYRKFPPNFRYTLPPVNPRKMLRACPSSPCLAPALPQKRRSGRSACRM